MPHEDLARSLPRISLKNRIAFYSRFFLDFVRISFSDYERKIDVFQQFFNGKQVGTIHRKFDFIEQVRALGYRGPEQVLFFPGQLWHLPAIIGLLDKYGTLLCKPRDGQQGQGIFRCDNEADLLKRLSEVRQPYIVQEFVPPLMDYRYVYHIDADVTYRFCYAKVRPEICGDGQTRVSGLTTRDACIPVFSKKKLLKYLPADQLASVPAKGERIVLVDSGNISKGAYGQVVKGDDLAALDKVMLPLIDDLQKRCKLNLTTFCFDLGVLRNDITPGNVTRDDYVFYEYQVPFGLSGYLAADEVEKNKVHVAKVFWEALMRGWVERQRNVKPMPVAG